MSQAGTICSQDNALCDLASRGSGSGGGYKPKPKLREMQAGDLQEACRHAKAMLFNLPMIDRPQPWNLPQLDTYVSEVLKRMADNRDVMGDERATLLHCL